MSRRSRAVRKGVIQANRHERRRQAAQDLPPNVKVGIFVVIAAIVLVAVIIGAVQKDDPTPTGTTLTLSEQDTQDTTLSEANCVSLRREWNSVVDLDFEKGQSIQADYRSIGCYGLCGDLVEDTDTPERETRCAYP